MMKHTQTTYESTNYQQTPPMLFQYGRSEALMNKLTFLLRHYYEVGIHLAFVIAIQLSKLL
jgi:hypothetical protein